jgi:mannose-6-phosphate isomerase-like protein (cupin superfamily)
MVVLLLGIVLLLAQSFGGNEYESGKSPYKNKTGAVMKGYLQDIESIATKNTDFRRVLYTTKQSQLVLMALKPGEEIGAEVHKSDQFFRVEEGSGKAVLDGVTTEVHAGCGSGRGETQHHKYRHCSNEALYNLFAPESSGRRCSPYPRRSRGRQRALRW